jgi:hypothetical protein
MAIWGQIAGAVIGGLGAKSAAKQQTAGAKEAADLAYKRTLPWGTSGMMGGASFDPETRQATMSLDPTLQAPYYAWLARANRGAMRQAEMEGSPYEMGKKFYEQEQAIYAPGQAQERLKQENRELAQGMFGSTGGAGRIQALTEAQGMQNLARQASAFDRAQNYYDNMRQREQGDIQNAVMLGKLPMKYAEFGKNVGAGLGSAATQGAGWMRNAATNQADTTASFWGGLGKQVTNYLGPNKYQGQIDAWKDSGLSSEDWSNIFGSRSK